MLECRPVALTELAIEAGVVRDDDGGVLDEGLDLGRVDRLSGDHLIRDAGQSGNLGRDRLRRLAQLREGVEHPVDAAVGAELEFDHGKLDDLVFLGVEPCRLVIEDDADFDRRAVAVMDPVMQLQPAQHAVIPCRLERGGERLEIGRGCGAVDRGAAHRLSLGNSAKEVAGPGEAHLVESAQSGIGGAGAAE